MGDGVKNRRLLGFGRLKGEDGGVPWSPGLVREAPMWVRDARDPSIAVVPEGLQVAVPAGATWRIAAADRIRLPDRVGEIRVRVARLEGKARWLLRVFGDLRGEGRPRTVGFFQDETRAGDFALAVDPRLLPRSPASRPNMANTCPFPAWCATG